MRHVFHFFSTLGCIALILGFFSKAEAQQITDNFSPEVATSIEAKSNKSPVFSKKWMVSVANPHAAETAAKVLKGGGNAIDAAIAAQLMLGLVEPQSSGLGGGAFLVYYDAKSGKLTTLDGRETAPMAATSRLFQKPNGEPMGFFDAVIGGRSVGVPGTPALLEKMHEKWGSRPWKELFEPSISLAESGFIVSQRLAMLLANGKKGLLRQKAATDLFIPHGIPLARGSEFKNQAYANTLRLLADEGTSPFYKGVLADQIVETVQSFKENPGVLTKADLSGYKVVERDPVCANYRQMQICGMGPPSSGALTIGQFLGILEPHSLEQHDPSGVEAWRLIGDATRLAFADRGRYMADSDFVKMPTKGLLKKDYLKSRSQLLKINRALDKLSPGKPSWDEAALPRSDDESLELPSTTHFSIVDGQGNVVSMTSTIENGFGSRLATNGFLLNNELTDFSFRAQKDGKPIANRVEPGKRPRSSMSPTIVMKDGRPVLAIGSPGGSRIIPYVAKTLIAHIDWGMNIQKAISSPHLVNRFGTFDIEAGTTAVELAPKLEAIGYKVKIRNLNSGLHGIDLSGDRLAGGADHRREGVVLGE